MYIKYNFIVIVIVHIIINVNYYLLLHYFGKKISDTYTQLQLHLHLYRI